MPGPLDKIKQYIANVPGAGISPFSYWGAQEKTAREQGWYASTEPDSNGAVTFRAPYDAPFNTVEIPGQKALGHVAIIGRPNQRFDVVINDATGQEQMKIFQGISPDDVEKWITSPDNTIAQRISGLQKKQFDPMSGQSVKPTEVATK